MSVILFQYIPLSPSAGGSAGQEPACNVVRSWVWSLGQEDPLEEGTATHGPDTHVCTQFIYTHGYIHTMYIHILNIHTFIYAHTYLYTHFIHMLLLFSHALVITLGNKVFARWKKSQNRKRIDVFDNTLLSMGWQRVRHILRLNNNNVQYLLKV